MILNNKSLLVIDSPYTLYMYSLMHCDEIIDIFVLLEKNYRKDEFMKFINFVISSNKKGNIYFFKDDFNWNTVRNGSTMNSVKEKLDNLQITEKKIKLYDNLYLNSAGKAISFYLSTLRPYIAIQHSPISILNHFPTLYFLESLKLFIRTRKFRYNYLYFCMSNSLKKIPAKKNYFAPFNCYTNDSFFKSFDLNKVFRKEKKDVGVLLWTNHYSYEDPFNIKYINLNLNIFHAAYKNYGKNLDCLIIKLHHRIPRPDKKTLTKIKSNFKKFDFNVILFDEIFNPESPHRIYPIEMFMNIFNINFVVGACTSAIWNASEKVSCKTYSAFQYKNSLVGRLTMVIKGIKSINKILKYIPTDLSKILNKLN